MPPKKSSSKKSEKPEKKSKKVNFQSENKPENKPENKLENKSENESENKNVFVKENAPDSELNETEIETEKDTELEQDQDQEQDEEEQELEDEDHEVDDEIEYDDENVEEVDDLYDDDENAVKPKKGKSKPKSKKVSSEEDDTKVNDLDDEDCEYDYNEIYDEKKEEPSVVVKPEDRITLPKLTKYERVRLIGTRAKQISLGAKVMVKDTNGLNSIEIAKLELSFKMIPMKIKRVLPDNKIEIWKLSELELDN
jgi:DNA-directed RNA polymerase I, II, and III subunit RPABC2